MNINHNISLKIKKYVKNIRIIDYGTVFEKSTPVNQKNNFMKNVIKILGVFMLVMFTAISFTSCSSDDDPADNDFFAGTYKGKITYNDGSTTVSEDNGSVFVTKIASATKYNFRFSNGIPDLNGLEFEKQGDNTLVMVGSNALVYVRIDNNELKMYYTADGKTWTANATR